MGDEMKDTRWIMPGNGNAGVNVNECWRVIGGERADRNAQGGWARYCTEPITNKIMLKKAIDPLFQGED